MNSNRGKRERILQSQLHNSALIRKGKAVRNWRTNPLSEHGSVVKIYRKQKRKRDDFEAMNLFEHPEHSSMKLPTKANYKKKNNNNDNEREKMQQRIGHLTNQTMTIQNHLRT
jgi:hypothetical protein